MKDEKYNYTNIKKPSPALIKKLLKLAAAQDKNYAAMGVKRDPETKADSAINALNNSYRANFKAGKTVFKVEDMHKVGLTLKDVKEHDDLYQNNYDAYLKAVTKALN